MRQIYEYGSALNIFNDIDIDKDNRIWFGGRLGLGMLQTTETGFEPLFFPELRNKLIGTIFFDDEGTLHVATIQGYYRIKWRQPALWDSDYIIEQPFSQLKDIFINRIYIDKERNLWIPTDSYGVFRTKGDSITLHLTKENGLLSSSIMCMLQDNEGIYWFGTTEGICMVKDFDNYAIENNGIRFKETKEFTADEFQRIWMYSRSALYAYQGDKYGYYWCADYTNGIYRGTVSRPENKNMVFDIATIYKSYTADSSFVTSLIRDMTFDKDGNLWFSSLYTGVYKLSIDNNGAVSHKLYSTVDGLISNNVYGITFHDDGSVWFLTQRGISVLRRDSTGVETINRLYIDKGIEGMPFSYLQKGDRLYPQLGVGSAYVHAKNKPPAFGDAINRRLYISKIIYL